MASSALVVVGVTAAARRSCPYRRHPNSYNAIRSSTTTPISKGIGLNRCFLLCYLAALRLSPATCCAAAFTTVSSGNWLSSATQCHQRNQQLNIATMSSTTMATGTRIMTRSRTATSSLQPQSTGGVVTSSSSVVTTSTTTLLTTSRKNYGRGSSRLQSSSSSLPAEMDEIVPDSAASSAKKRKRRSVTPSDTSNAESEETPPKSPRTTKVKGSKSSSSSGVTKKSPPKKKKMTKSSSMSPKKSSPKKKATSEPVSMKPPDNWEDIYSLVEELRKDYSAPVDSDGSEALPDKTESPETFRFQVLIALMLSSQTKDAIVGETMRNLQQYGLTIDNISTTSHEKLNSLIGKVGFHNNKTKYIKQVVDILKDQYDSDIPQTADEMMELPGIGPKMAYIIENVAWDRVSGIGIDTHMHRMFNELKWVKSKNPEQTRLQLEAWLPREKWSTVNKLWVGFGQEVQQYKPKLLKKALQCSRPSDALRLVKKLGLDYTKEGAKLNLTDEIKQVLKKK